jgi:hypothetical protein
VAAARLADVGAADPQPVVGGGVGQHRGEERAVGLLDGLALGERAPRVGDAAGERIADLLERTEVEHPRRARGGDPVRHVDPPESRGDQPGKLALEPPDLTPQLGAGQPLVDGDSFEHSRHGQILSRLEGRRSNP